MKLLLASDGNFLINQGYKLLGIPKEQIKIGYVITAPKGASNNNYIKLHEKLMTEQGYDFEEIDIEGKSKNELEKIFSDKNVIHIEGGHTYYLLSAIKRTGFDKFIKKLMERGVIYVGTSAGSSIMGPTIELTSHVPVGIKKGELVALNFVPYLVKCHYKDENRTEYIERVKGLKYPVKFLRDGQGILIEDDKSHLVGRGEEVVI